jgi:hypothetical protein
MAKDDKMSGHWSARVLFFRFLTQLSRFPGSGFGKVDMIEIGPRRR